MVTIADILALPAFSKVQMIAPCKGAGARTVHNVGILDCPPDYNGYSNYFPGELIVTNMGFANGDAELSQRSLVALIDRHVAGIAIKTVYDPIVTDAVRRESTQEGVPVFVYDGAYHEVVAYQALDLIQRDARDIDKTTQVEALLVPQGPEEVCARLMAICGATGSDICFVAAMPDGGDDFSSLAAISAIQRSCERIEGSQKQVSRANVFRYGKRIVCAISYATSASLALGKTTTLVAGEGEGPVSLKAASPVDEALSVLRETLLTLGSLYCGVSERLPISQGDICVQEALEACEVAARHGERWLSWSNLGEDAFACAASQDALFHRAAASLLSRVEAYDRSNGTELTETLRAFVAAGGEVSTTAERLYQHPNTIRYRLKKIKSLVGDSHLTDRRLLVVASLMLLPGA